MCLSVVFSLLTGLLPLILLLCMPIYGSFFGIDIVLRFSLLLCLHALATTIFAHIPVFQDSLLQLGLAAAAVALPVNFIPHLLLAVYGLILQLSKPIWILCEVVGLFLFIRKISSELQEHLDDQPDKAKAVALGIAGGSYMVIGFIVYHIISIEAAAVTQWSLIMTMTICLVLHIIMWYADAGIISDAAFISMCCFGAVYFIHLTYYPTKDILEPPETWENITENNSIGQMVLKLSTLSIESTKKGFQFLWQLLSPGFIVMAVVRLYGVVISGSLLQQYMFQDEEYETVGEDDIDTDSDDGAVIQTLPDWMVRPWNYPLTTRLSVIFVYTQLVSFYIYESATGGSRRQFPFNIFDGIPFGRFSQIGLFATLYLLELKKSESERSEW